MAVELASFADVKALLKLESATSGDYPKYTWIAPSVQATIATYLGATFDYSSSAVETVFIGLDKTRLVPLKRLPIASVTSITLDGTGISDYKITPWGLRLGSSVQDVIVVVTYAGGYTTTPDTVPADLKRAAVLQVAYEMQSSDQIGATSLSTDGGTISRPELGLLKEVKRVLQPYRNPYVVGPV